MLASLNAVHLSACVILQKMAVAVMCLVLSLEHAAMILWTYVFLVSCLDKAAHLSIPQLPYSNMVSTVYDANSRSLVCDYYCMQEPRSTVAVTHSNCFCFEIFAVAFNAAI